MAKRIYKSKTEKRKFGKQHQLQVLFLHESEGLSLKKAKGHDLLKYPEGSGMCRSLPGWSLTQREGIHAIIASGSSETGDGPIGRMAIQ
ncbi:hypothetical protein N7468_000062 [Penicillium chermesinum]|uniref:Uncharacterized protein n=1 Tax=Penicillium chermesinum TaxID=63820 RepID=A0A9W9PJI7_9EURO|nr:uncharacterized protein N7468_000062 [Penicillium chermesinum]KAJ5248611.1 hypothetical protein N7468_000062 [Penicillium chermesinum]